MHSSVLCVLSSLYNLLYSNSRSDGFTPSYTHADRTPAAPNQGEKKRPQYMHLSVPGACPYLTMMVNILTLLTKGDRRREGGREDGFLRMYRWMEKWKTGREMRKWEEKRRARKVKEGCKGEKAQNWECNTAAVKLLAILQLPGLIYTLWKQKETKPSLWNIHAQYKCYLLETAEVKWIACKLRCPWSH